LKVKMIDIKNVLVPVFLFLLTTFLVVQVSLHIVETTKKTEELMEETVDSYKEIDISSIEAIEDEKILTREKKDRLVFVGDIFFSNNIRRSYNDGGVDAIISESFRKVLESSDLNIANLECSITDDDDKPYDKTYVFALPTKYASALKEIGIGLFTLANNHILDFGVDALSKTMEILDNLGIAHVGAGTTLQEAKKAYIKVVEGKKYAIIGASAVLPDVSWIASESRGGVYNGYNIEKVAEDIKDIKSLCDKVIVYMHWGKELEGESNKTQKAFAHKLVDAGADLVIGTHPHITEEVEYYNGVPIVYSLGNFIYGGQSRDMYMCEAIFDYSDNPDGSLRLKLYPGISGYKSTREYDTDRETQNKIINLNKKSRECYIDKDGYVYSLDEKKNIDLEKTSSSDIIDN